MQIAVIFTPQEEDVLADTGDFCLVTKQPDGGVELTIGDLSILLSNSQFKRLENEFREICEEDRVRRETNRPTTTSLTE